MKKQFESSEKGFTIIETVLSIAIFVMITMALFNIFDSVLRTIRNNKAILTANAIVLEQMEIVRGMNFDNVKTDTGWYPAGPLPSEKTVVRNGISYLVRTDVSFFDDPYDRLEDDATEPDTFPYDYKKVRLRISWTNPVGGGTAQVAMSTNVVPEGMEGLSDGKGGLYLSAFDALGSPIAAADVEIDNDALGYALAGAKTDLNGNLWIPDLDPSNSYHIRVTKAGYSVSETYAINSDAASSDYNPVPSKPDASVIAGSVSKLGFSIDLLGSMNIKTVHFDNPGNLLVNAETLGEQTNATMAFGPGGALYVAWTDNRDDILTTHIYLQKFNYNAGSGSYARAWAADTRAVNQSGAAAPELTVLPDGSPVIAWSDSRSGDSNVYVQKFSSSNGNPAGGEYQLNHDGVAAAQTNPSLGSDQDGNVYVVWEDNRDGSWDVYGQKVDLNAGTLWGSDLLVSSSIAAEQLNPKIVLDRDLNAGLNDNHLYVVWQSNHTGNFNVFFSKLDRSGNVLVAEKQVNSDGSALDQYAPSLVYDGSNFLYLAWADERNSQPDIFLEKLDKNGANQLAADTKINDDSFAAARRLKPAVAVGSDGNVYVSWEDNRNGDTTFNIYANKIDTSANRLWTYDMILSDTLSSIQTDAVTVCDSYGQALTVWQDNRSGIDNDLFGAAYDSMGNVQRGSVSITVTSEKTKGNYPNVEGAAPDFLPIPKYSRTFASDGNGDIHIDAAAGGLEWGTYTFAAVSPYDITSIDLPSPISVLPDTEANVVINVGP